MITMNYKNEHLNRIVFPLGGMGAGMLPITGYGGLLERLGADVSLLPQCVKGCISGLRRVFTAGVLLQQLLT